jgi:hypothetical protein
VCVISWKYYKKRATITIRVAKIDSGETKGNLRPRKHIIMYIYVCVCIIWYNAPLQHTTAYIIWATVKKNIIIRHRRRSNEFLFCRKPYWRVRIKLCNVEGCCIATCRSAKFFSKQNIVGFSPKRAIGTTIT